MSFEATNPGVDGNTITIALVSSTNPMTTVTVANKDITIGVGGDAATLTRKKLIDLINNHKDAKKLIVASTTMPEANFNLFNGTNKVLLNKVPLEGGISQLTEVMLTFSESVTYTGDFTVNTAKTEATPIGDNDRILLHSFVKPILLTKASTTLTIKTPKVKDKVGNTTQETELTKSFILTDNQLLEKP